MSRFVEARQGTLINLDHIALLRPSQNAPDGSVLFYGCYAAPDDSTPLTEPDGYVMEVHAALVRVALGEDLTKRQL